MVPDAGPVTLSGPVWSGPVWSGAGWIVGGVDIVVLATGAVQIESQPQSRTQEER
ncbi:hypothetical protein NF557_12755 [Ornithinimicrobium cryptoxanthini]|uniref:Uncharacterized protein n=1 Tax=Ornithinimicrobium cryptoxanthini TaxID=2934161 RepID=A0ABY4YFT9_9MICO|nr:hypothetical protein [Ornithinimicrobium cryptoxanthini]USQ75482.1 hypothetical protein NF557_12755 [Ornithinimicrobium cryptoxanthini]